MGAGPEGAARRGCALAFRSLDHIGFTVSSLDRAVEFYSLLLGEPPTLRQRFDVPYVGEVIGYQGVAIEAAFWNLPGGRVLELIEYLVPAGQRVDMETYNVGNAHLCLTTDDIHGDAERLRGVALLRSEQAVEIPWGPFRGGFALYLRDPDGITIELLQHPPGGVNLEQAASEDAASAT